jgi:hypothetical protein
MAFTKPCKLKQTMPARDYNHAMQIIDTEEVLSGVSLAIAVY